MKVVVLTLAFITSLSGFGDNNPYLEHTMKVISKDVALVQEPTKKTNAGDVLDSTILTAMIRTRTAISQLRLTIDRREGELMPAVVKTMSAAEQKDKLDLFAAYLEKAIVCLQMAESQLKAEYDKVASSRSFVALKGTLGQLGVIIGEAHGLFKPQPE